MRYVTPLGIQKDLVMIVDTMNMEEIGKAIMKVVKYKMICLASVTCPMDKVYKRIVLKGDKRYDFKPLKKVVDGITFYVCPYSRSKKDYKKYGIMYGLFAHFFYQGTNWYAMLCGNGDSVTFYKQHFFERYIERHLKDGSKISIDTVRHYFKETDYLTSCKMIENPKYPNCVYGATNIGVCCGYHCDSGKIIVWLTYIDKETLSRGDKKDLFDESADRFTPIGIDAQGNRIF